MAGERCHHQLLTQGCDAQSRQLLRSGTTCHGLTRGQGERQGNSGRASGER